VTRHNFQIISTRPAGVSFVTVAERGKAAPIDCFVTRVRTPTREFLREIVAACLLGVSTETNLCRADISVLGGGCIITLHVPQRLQDRNTWTS
jgi:hypothetical protein